MGVEVSEQRKPTSAEANDQGETTAGRPLEVATPPTGQGIAAQIMDNLRTGIRELQWRPVLLFGVAAGLLMPLSFLQTNLLSIVAGLIPVGTGLLLGRRVKAHYGLHGFFTGAIGALVGLVVRAVMLFLTPLGAVELATINATPAGAGTALLDLWLTTAGFIAFSLITFCTFGTTMAGRTEQRNREARKEVDSRGGKLERPGTIRTPDDVRGLSLPQFGTYVSNLFKKNGFKLKEYRFVDKDKHLDLWMEYEDEPWHLRLSVADKVNPGTIEGLNQELKREGCRKGVVITSTEFTPGALKSAKGRLIVLIDGPMLYQIAEK